MTRFVAVGDSLTEGIGDPVACSPNGWRGWADLLAARLADHDPGTEYANLALRGKATRQVLLEQVAVAAALRPTIATIWVGGNDLMRPVPRFRDVVDDVAESIDCFVRAGADVLVLSGMRPHGSLLLRPLANRVDRLDRALRGVARSMGAEIVDITMLPIWATAAGWAPDRVHPSLVGHRRIADRVSEVLGLPATTAFSAAESTCRATDSATGGRCPDRSRTTVDAIREEFHWWSRDVIPHFGRWATRASAREFTPPKYADPVRPASAFAWLGDEGARPSA